MIKQNATVFATIAISMLSIGIPARSDEPCCFESPGRCVFHSTSGVREVILCGSGNVCCLAFSNSGDGSVGAIGCCPGSQGCTFFSTLDGQVHYGCGEDPAQLGGF